MTYLAGSTEVDLAADIIDSRDIIARIEWLQGSCSGKEEAEEYRDLLKFQEEAEGYSPDWHHGSTLIHERYFETYAQELAEDCCEIPTGWPSRCIDWGQAACELEQDYTSFEVNGETYLVQ